MRSSTVSRVAVMVAGLSLIPASLVATAAAAQAYPSGGSQDYPQQSGGYGGQYQQAPAYPQQGYPQQNGYPQQQGYPQQNGDPQEYAGMDDYDRAAPSDYDPSRPPPPPPGYRADPAYTATVEQDRRYEAYAEDWSQRYCTRAHSNAGAGAVIGGLFGALVGSSVTGRRDRGAGALVGGIAGAAAAFGIGRFAGSEA